MSDDRSEPRADKLYGRRKGPKLRARRAGLLETLLPQLRVPLEGPAPIDPLTLFAPGIGKVWLEIGFGGGEHLAWQARNNPQVGLIGCEPFVNGVANLLSVIEGDGLTNVRILDDDARALLPRLADGSIARVFVLFPDPWPKRRHHKRRLVNQQTLSQIHRILIPGGELRVASDIGDYIRWTLIEVRRHGGFDWLAETAKDWRNRPEDWPETRYEAKAVREQRTPVYLNFRRSPLPSTQV